MKPIIKTFIALLFLFVLAQCSREEAIEPSITIVVVEPVITMIEGETVDWNGTYLATDEAGHDLTALVTRSIDDTSVLLVGVHDITLSLSHNALFEQANIKVNVLLTDEEILFDMPDEILIFEAGTSLAKDDFSVTAQTASGFNLSDRIVMTGYNLDDLQIGFHYATFTIQVSETEFEMIDVPFEVRDGQIRLEHVNSLHNITIRQYEVVGNQVYVLGFHWEDEDVYGDLLIFDLNDQSISSITAWTGNLHGTGPQPHSGWEGFAIHDNQIHVLKYEAYLVDETAEGTDQFEYHTKVDVYEMDLTYDHTYELLGMEIDIPTHIAINDQGDIAIAGYAHRTWAGDFIGVFNADRELQNVYGGRIRSLLPVGDAFLAAGYSSGYYSSHFDGIAFKFDTQGLIWDYKERGIDMDTFIYAKATDNGFLLFGETSSYGDIGGSYVGYAVRLDSDGNFQERVIYPEARFPFPSLAMIGPEMWIVSFDVVRYPDSWADQGWSEHRIPQAFRYDDEGTLLGRYPVYFEKYVMFENAIVVPYGDEIYVIASMGYHRYDESDIGDPETALFFVKVYWEE